MKKLKYRVAIALALLSALLLATGICTYVKRDAPKAIQAESARISDMQIDPVTRFRTEREELRNRQIGELNDIIHSDSADSDTVNMAQRQLMNLMKTQEAELKLEGLLRMRGFEDALVTAGDSSVNVILRAHAPTRQESAVILDLVLRETGVTAGNVKILSINQ